MFQPPDPPDPIEREMERRRFGVGRREGVAWVWSREEGGCGMGME